VNTTGPDYTGDPGTALALRSPTAIMPSNFGQSSGLVQQVGTDPATAKSNGFSFASLVAKLTRPVLVPPPSVRTILGLCIPDKLQAAHPPGHPPAPPQPRHNHSHSLWLRRTRQLSHLPPSCPMPRASPRTLCLLHSLPGPPLPPSPALPHSQMPPC